MNGECICPTGFFGPTCEDDGHDYCAHKPCANGGTCIDLTNDFECRCVAGFVGPTCQINVDDCEMRPCANGGHCTDLVNDFLCRCQPGWTGKDCSVNVDNCLLQPCLHGGVCHDRIDDYECECPDGFWGKDCQLYEGMSTTPAPPTTQPAALNTTHAATRAPVTSEDPLHQSGNASGLAGGDDELSTPQLLVVVCLGAGLPILLIIVVVVILLCRKRRQQAQNMDKERHQNYINNMNNRGDSHHGKGLDARDAKCVDDDGGGVGGGGGGGVSGSGVGTTSAASIAAVGKAEGKYEGGGSGASTIFTTPYSHHAAAALMPAAPSVMKISNEEQQDINRFNSQQHRAYRDKAASKNFIRDSLVHEPPYPSPAPAPALSSNRNSCVYDYEKPIRRLDVDTLSEDTKVDIRCVSLPL